MNAQERQVVQRLIDAAYASKELVRHSPIPGSEQVFARLVLSIAAVEDTLALDGECPPTPRNTGR